jgi:hypothetical protein
MLKNLRNTLPIFSTKNLTRVLWLAIITLALAAGFLQSALEVQERKYKALEDRYVRLRYMVGSDKAQQLIQESYNYIDNRGVVIQEMEYQDYE